MVEKLKALSDFRKYKQVLVKLLALELIRGLLIVLIAWLLQSAIISEEFGIILLCTMIGRVFVENIRSKRFNELSLNFQEDSRKRLHKNWFEHYERGRSGELLTLMFETVETFDDFLVKVLPNILTIIVLVPMIILVAAVVDPLTALIFLLTLPIAPFLLYLIGGAISKRNQQALAKVSKLNADFKELIAAITTLKIFKQSEAALDRLKTTSEQSAQTTLDVLKLAFVSAFVLELITTLSIALIAVTVGLRLVDASIAFDVALFLLILAPEFYSPIRQIGAAFHAAVRVVDSQRLIGARSKGQISNGVSHLSLDPRPLTLTIVTGESGSGKSTLLRKFVKEYKSEAIAYLPQQPHLFKTSIRNNVTLFKEVDDSLILQALDEVGLNLVVSNQQLVDSRLEDLSRGELQRLGLARVLVKVKSLDPCPLTFTNIILDEPTAALDVNTKQLIISLIVRLKQRHTLIIATHDPEIIKLADKIIAVSDS